MRADWAFEHSAEEREFVEKYWGEQQPRLERVLTEFSPDQRKLHLTLRRRTIGAPWMFRATLHLSERTLVAEAFGFRPQEAIDRTLDELVRDLQSSKRSPLEERSDRPSGARRRFDDVAPYLELDVAESRPETFFRLLMPLLGSLREYARHELNILELEGAIPVNELTPEDLVDEVLVAAWERFKLRPPTGLLDVWLTCLLQQRLDELCRQVKPITLVASRAAARSLYTSVDEPFQNDLLSMEELIPDYEGGEAWNRLSEDDRRRQLAAALALLSKRQRQALMLRAVSGFQLAEIATVLDVSEDQIAEWLRDARQILRARLEGSTDM
jgi:RNA polymerase sigma factor (sigma-70 family)